MPQVKAALGGTRKVPAQSEWVEAWLTYTIYYSRDRDSVTIQDLLYVADCLSKELPTSDEVSWAILQLMKRGWLFDKDGSYGLTPQARGQIEEIIVDGLDVWDDMHKLEAWMSGHPAGTDSADGNRTGDARRKKRLQ